MITRGLMTRRIRVMRTLSYRRSPRDRMGLVSPDMPPVDPHPELVAVQRPTPREVVQVAALFGWLRDEEDRVRPVPIGGSRV